MLSKAICAQLETQRKDLQRARDALQVLVDNYQDFFHANGHAHTCMHVHATIDFILIPLGAV